jgi:hypothetical protein
MWSAEKLECSAMSRVLQGDPAQGADVSMRVVRY